MSRGVGRRESSARRLHLAPRILRICGARTYPKLRTITYHIKDVCSRISRIVRTIRLYPGHSLITYAETVTRSNYRY